MILAFAIPTSVYYTLFTGAAVLLMLVIIGARSLWTLRRSACKEPKGVFRTYLEGRYEKTWASWFTCLLLLFTLLVIILALHIFDLKY
jgi:hypothetical protein